MWQEAGFPLEAVLSGIDATFEKYAARQAKGRVRKINGLAYCAQEVLRAVEDMHEAATGALRKQPSTPEESGFEASRIAAFVRANAEAVRECATPEKARDTYGEISRRLESIAASLEGQVEFRQNRWSSSCWYWKTSCLRRCRHSRRAEDLLALREQSSRELAPYRSRLQTVQIRQIEQQFLRRSLFRTELPTSAEPCSTCATHETDD